MEAIEQLEKELMEHSRKVGMITDSSKIAAMLASRWEDMQNHRISSVMPLSILPLLESAELVMGKDYREYGTIIEFKDLNEQIGVVRTQRIMSWRAHTYHANLRKESYYS